MTGYRRGGMHHAKLAPPLMLSFFMAGLLGSGGCADQRVAHVAPDIPVESPHTDEPAASEVDQAADTSEPAISCPALDFTPDPSVLVAPKLAGQPQTGACWKLPKSIQTKLRKDVRDAWSFAHDPHKLDIDFGCDRLGAVSDIHEITLQWGSGHGGTLNLARLRRTDDASGWDLLVLRNSSYYGRPEDMGTFRGQVAATDLDDALTYARAALTVEANEPPKSGSGSYSMSSGDMHTFVRLTDTRGRSRGMAWSGYMGSEDQEVWIPASLAEAALTAVVNAAALSRVDPDTDSQRFFAERFAEGLSQNYYGEFAAWWVHARLVQMAGVHGTNSLIPALGARLCPIVDEHAHGGHPRADALLAIFALIGQDPPQLPEDDEARTNEWITAWASACGVPCPQPVSG
ncbi:hypothetical protein DB30_00183 [Enhygromyxa salina]|uniref:Uncharacterized protein n=1 Tax=Enhygromyxa salina TaxID=215803 RepID=A0A0C2A508_9BACT|nr:hypothetical protein [Enhygromyxa salina]KIG18498.1 hypothetical protein DB30_00183 [Enhygromyxa salina]